MLEINILLLFMIGAAVIAMETKDLLSGVVAIGAAGIGLSMAFLVLKAPELAMMQLVVEILCLIILISATIKRDLPFSTSGRWLFNTFSTLFFIVVFLGAAYLALKGMPRFGESMPMRISSSYLKNAAAGMGPRNVVAAIAEDYRVYDTLGEAVIVFTSLIGVLAISRKNAKAKGE
jgi:multisubunit Na+/H+ antiporter MnhB subunit